MNSKIKLGIPNKNAKTVEVGGQQYTIPTLTLYHRKYLIDYEVAENVYDMVVPVIRQVLKLRDDQLLDTDVFEYLVVKLFEHNNLLNKTALIEGEMFSIENMELCGQTEFNINGVEYRFNKPDMKNNYSSYLDGLNELHIGDKIDFSSLGVEYFRMAFAVFSTIKIVGNLGNEIRGLNQILDNFTNKNLVKELGGRYEL